MDLSCGDFIRQMKDRGADLVGIGNLSGLHELHVNIRGGCHSARRHTLDPSWPNHGILRRIPPDQRAFERYRIIRGKIPTDRGYKAYAQTTEAVKEYGHYRTALPIKPSRPVRGWDGLGNALLVTEEFAPPFAYPPDQRGFAVGADACAAEIVRTAKGAVPTCHYGELWHTNVIGPPFSTPINAERRQGTWRPKA